MFKNNKYNFAAFILYMAYFLHGIQAILLSQNTALFSEQWGTNTAGVLAVIAWTGIGKISFLVFSGTLADKFGRKPIAIIGMLGYVALFAMLLVTTNIYVANILSFIGGAATSMFDGAINPAVMEIYPNHKSTASIINKGAIAVSGTIYPLLIAYLNSNSYSLMISIWVPLLISIAVLVAMFFITLPDGDIKKQQNVSASEAVRILETTQSTEVSVVTKVKEPVFAFDGIVLAIFGFSIYSTFYLFQQVIKIYATDVVGMTELGASSLVSYYQIASFAAVLLSAVIMARGIREMALLVIYPLLSTVAALAIYIHPTETMLAIGSAVIGFTAAGGALQMGNALLNQFFDQNKGRNTSIYYFIMSLGSYIMPSLASHLMQADFTLIMLCDAIVAGIAFITMAIMAFRYKQIFGVSAFSKKEA